jgi:hypothetical protein
VHEQREVELHALRGGLVLGGHVPRPLVRVALRRDQPHERVAVVGIAQLHHPAVGERDPRHPLWSAITKLACTIIITIVVFIITKFAHTQAQEAAGRTLEGGAVGQGEGEGPLGDAALEAPLPPAAGLGQVEHAGAVDLVVLEVALES